MSNNNPINFATATPAEIKKWEFDYEENMHSAFVEAYSGLLDHPARVAQDRWLEIVDVNSREVMESVISQGLHVDLTIYDKGDQEPVFGLCLTELTECCCMGEHARPHMSNNPDRQYLFAFKSRKEALAFITELTLVGDDLV